MSIHQSTDVVIVGGGVIGCSIAYFLCKAGVEVMAGDDRACHDRPAYSKPEKPGVCNGSVARGSCGRS